MRSAQWLRRLGALAAALAMPTAGLACACGCGIFEVDVGSMFAVHGGTTLFLERDYSDQDRNWSGTASAPAGDNDDKRIRTVLTTLGVQYMWSRAWSAVLEIPYWDRQFTTAATDSAAVQTFSHGALGDIRIKATYSGFSSDLSTAITAGLKLPSGDSTYANFDPDTEIGSGSIDLLLAAYHLGKLTQDNRWSWFTSAAWQQPVQHESGYRPGSELDAGGGIYYGGWRIGALQVVPIMQLTATYRRHDGGVLGDPLDTGYTRAYVAPGVELESGRLRIYADLGLPVYTNASGNQLTAPVLFKLNVSYHL